jgi:hypothetical protein
MGDNALPHKVSALRISSGGATEAHFAPSVVKQKNSYEPAIELAGREFTYEFVSGPRRYAVHPVEGAANHSRAVSPLRGIRRSLLRAMRAITSRPRRRSKGATCTCELRRNPRIRVFFSRLVAAFAIVNSLRAVPSRRCAARHQAFRCDSSRPECPRGHDQN